MGEYMKLSLFIFGIALIISHITVWQVSYKEGFRRGWLEKTLRGVDKNEYE